VRQSAVFSGISIADGQFEEHDRGSQTSTAGRRIPDGRTTTHGVIRLERVIPQVGLEPTPSCVDRILSPARLPSAWHWKQVGLTVKLLVGQAVTSPLFCQEHCGRIGMTSPMLLPNCPGPCLGKSAGAPAFGKNQACFSVRCDFRFAFPVAFADGVPETPCLIVVVSYVWCPRNHGTKWSARRLSDPSRMVISDAYPRMSLPRSVASTDALDPT
jgi:hypothetical protein